MDLLQLQYFQTTARIGHMSKAAEELYIAQPTLSKTISRLERELGFPLFNRSGRQIQLSPYGELFLEYTNQTLKDLDSCLLQMNSLKENCNLNLSFALNIPSLLAPILEGFLPLNKKINVKNEIGSTLTIRKKLEAREVSFCISCPPIEGNSIQCIPLLKEELYLMVQKKHPMALKKSVKLSDFSKELFISFKKNHGIRDLTETLCQNAGFTPNIVYEGDINNDLMKLVNIGMGVALLPGKHPWTTSSDFDDIAMLHVADAFCHRTIGLSFLKSRTFSPAEKQFKNYILERFSYYQRSLEFRND